jgi:hypothetical protein
MSRKELKIEAIKKMCYNLWLRSDQSFNRLVAAQTLERKLIEIVKEKEDANN